MKFAVITTGGKQYVVSEGDKLRIEKLDQAVGTVTFDRVLLVVDGEKVAVGTPTVPGATVTANVTGAGKGKKKIVFRYKAKVRYRKKKGHRQPYTEVQVTNIAA